MDENIINKELIDQTIGFHGHWCPGLAIGIRAAEYALKEMGKAPDEEIVAVVETDMCGVDAIQFLVGCTFGKGNLIHKDYGKTAFTFYRRSDGKAARLVTRADFHGQSGSIDQTTDGAVELNVAELVFLRFCLDRILFRGVAQVVPIRMSKRCVVVQAQLNI